MCIIHLSHFHGTAQAGTCVMPLKNRTVVRNVHRKVHPLLASSSASLIPPTLGYYDARKVKQTEPLSAAALRRVERAVDHAFRSHYRETGRAIGSPHHGGASSRSRFKSLSGGRMPAEYDVRGSEHASAVMKSSLVACMRRLRESLKLTQEELGDLVPFGGKWCKEWLFELSLTMGVKANQDDNSDFNID